MGKQSSAQITATFTGDGMEGTFAPAPLTNTPSAPSQGSVVVTLAAGDNVVPCPANTKGALFSPGTTADLFLKGNVADVGFALDATQSSMVAVPGAPASIILNSTAGGTIYIAWL